MQCCCLRLHLPWCSMSRVAAAQLAAFMLNFSDHCLWDRNGIAETSVFLSSWERVNLYLERNSFSWFSFLIFPILILLATTIQLECKETCPLYSAFPTTSSTLEFSYYILFFCNFYSYLFLCSLLTFWILAFQNALVSQKHFHFHIKISLEYFPVFCFLLHPCVCEEH